MLAQLARGTKDYDDDAQLDHDALLLLQPGVGA
jgi:hypothetical protein